MIKDFETMAKSNRLAWNEASIYHQAARKNSLYDGFSQIDFTVFDRDCDSVLLEKLNRIDLEGKMIAQLPCNNGRKLLSLMRFGAKHSVGFDISDEAVKEARKLADIFGMDADFHRMNALEIPTEHNGLYDFIYISEESLQWFPDLQKYFSVVFRLLRNGGSLLIFEMHPFAYFFILRLGAGERYVSL